MRFEYSPGFQSGLHPMSLRPTVFVGLGGSGLRILTLLRRKLHERLGAPDYWPVFRFLGIDADQDDLRQLGPGHSRIEGLDERYRCLIGLSAAEFD